MRGSGSRRHRLGAALALYAAWTLATYLLEGRLLTLQRPEATAARAAYALVANVLVGIAGAGVALQGVVRAGADPGPLGFGPPRRIARGVLLGLLLGLVLSLAAPPPTVGGLAALNAFAQVWPVSVAEVLVCWAVLGTAIEGALREHALRRAALPLAWLGAALAFGLYHLAHSPPFDSARMIVLLTGVGLATGGFFVLTREVFGTILFHNVLAFKGVVTALAESGGLAPLGRPRPALLATAFLATVALAAVARMLTRTAAAPSRPR